MTFDLQKRVRAPFETAAVNLCSPPDDILTQIIRQVSFKDKTHGLCARSSMACSPDHMLERGCGVRAIS